ncbi:MAG: hypothetical protein JXA30_19185 [Deltaproteobacteria bacterium]|nr:hypothetical protein [Deltaproteobacteria bacterium]
MFATQLNPGGRSGERGPISRRYFRYPAAIVFVALVLSELSATARTEAQVESTDDEEEQEHAGFFSRVFIGVGYGSYIGNGRFDPTPGVRLIEDPAFGSPALNLALDGGIAVIDNLALHIGVAFETLLLSEENSGIDAFFLFGIGVGATYYFMPFDFYLSGHIRLAGALFYLPDAPCSTAFWEKLEGFGGVGLSLAFGKEWFSSDNDAGIGIGLQGNYVYLGDSPNFNYFSILLIPTLVSF